jgi:hypothetical protein
MGRKATPPPHGIERAWVRVGRYDMEKRLVGLCAFLFVAALAAAPAGAGMIVAPADLAVADPGATDFGVPISGVSFSSLSAGDVEGRDGRFVLPQAYEATFAPAQSGRPLGRPLRRGAAGAALPEPATLLLLGSGLAALAAGRRFSR